MRNVNFEAKIKPEWRDLEKHFKFNKSQIWTILSKVKGSYLSSVTTVVTLDGLGRGGKAAVGSCMEVVIKSPTLVLPVLEQNWK